MIWEIPLWCELYYIRYTHTHTKHRRRWRICFATDHLNLEAGRKAQLERENVKKMSWMIWEIPLWCELYDMRYTHTHTKHRRRWRTCFATDHLNLSREGGAVVEWERRKRWVECYIGFTHTAKTNKQNRRWRICFATDHLNLEAGREAHLEKGGVSIVCACASVRAMFLCFCEKRNRSHTHNKNIRSQTDKRQTHTHKHTHMTERPTAQHPFMWRRRHRRR